MHAKLYFTSTIENFLVYPSEMNTSVEFTLFVPTQQKSEKRLVFGSQITFIKIKTENLKW